MSERFELEKFVDGGPIEVKGRVGDTRLYSINGRQKQMFLLTNVVTADNNSPVTDHVWLACHPTNPAKDPKKGSVWQGFVKVIPYTNNIGDFGFKMLRLLTPPKPKPIIKKRKTLRSKETELPRTA